MQGINAETLTPYGCREVKSGEELRELFTSPNALFIGVCEGTVKSEESLAQFSAAPYCCNILPLHPYRCNLLGSAYEQDACFIVMRNTIVLYYDYLLEVI